MPIRAGWRRVRGWFTDLLHLDESAHSIAMGVAIGVFISFTPTVRFQMVLILAVSSLVGANRLAGVPMAWITNPATIVPIYWFNYWIGVKMVGGEGLTSKEFSDALESVTRHEGWWEMVKAWWGVVSDVALPLWAGSVLVGVVAAAIGYAIMFYAIVGARSRLARLKALREARRTARAARHSAAEGAAGAGVDTDPEDGDER